MTRGGIYVEIYRLSEANPEGFSKGSGYIMPYDTHGGGHRGELRLYCPRTEVKFSKIMSGAQRHESSRKISLPSEDNIRAQCRAPVCVEVVLS